MAQARWWSIRLAANRKPVTYTCPLCGQLLPALGEHMLMLPEGDASRRRHAHRECVLRARAQGLLPTREEWQRQEDPSEPGGVRGWLRRRRQGR